jgi:plasmid stability protein
MSAACFWTRSLAIFSLLFGEPIVTIYLVNVVTPHTNTCANVRIMALVLPADLQLYLSQRSARLGTSVEDTLLDVLYAAMRTEQQEELEASKGSGDDVWSGITKEAQAKQAYHSRKARGTDKPTH